MAKKTDIERAVEGLRNISDIIDEIIRNLSEDMTTEETRPLRLEEVRPVLAEKSRAGHTSEIRELLLKHGAEKLSEVDPKEYAQLLAEVEAL